MYNVVNQDPEAEGMNITLFQLLLLLCIAMVCKCIAGPVNNEVGICCANAHFLQLCTGITKKINPVKN